tara:strand:- start:15928 stop:16113 length:186 start_codon:yes stop_codon:yes gene_type:complete
MGIFKKLLEENTEEEVMEIIRRSKLVDKNQAKKVNKSTKSSCVKALEVCILNEDRGPNKCH